MAQQTINNLETGLVVRGKINENFTEVYSDIATNSSGVFSILNYANGEDIWDGVTIATTAFTDTITAAAVEGGIVLIPTTENGSTYLIDDDVTIPSNVFLWNIAGAILKGSLGTETLTINGGMNNDLYQKFDNIVLAGSPLIKSVYPEWFGAIGDGVTNDSSAFTSAISLLSDNSTFKISNKVYKLDSTALFRDLNNINIECEGRIYATASTVTSSVNVFAYYDCTNILIDGLDIYSTRTETTVAPTDHTRENLLGSNRTGLNLFQCVDVEIRNCKFDTLNYDVRTSIEGSYVPETSGYFPNQNIKIINCVGRSIYQGVYAVYTDTLIIDNYDVISQTELGSGDHHVYLSSYVKNVDIKRCKCESADNYFGVSLNLRTSSTTGTTGNEQDPHLITINDCEFVNCYAVISVKADTEVEMNNCVLNNVLTYIDTTNLRTLNLNENCVVSVSNSVFNNPLIFLMLGGGDSIVSIKNVSGLCDKIYENSDVTDVDIELIDCNFECSDTLCFMNSSSGGTLKILGGSYLINGSYALQSEEDNVKIEIVKSLIYSNALKNNFIFTASVNYDASNTFIISNDILGFSNLVVAGGTAITDINNNLNSIVL